MKKRLLKPSQNNGELILLPEKRLFLNQIQSASVICAAHQPYFFHPGISLKFILLESLPKGRKEAIFLDTDIVKIEAKIPVSFNAFKIISLVDTNSVLYNYPTPEKDKLYAFFNDLEDNLKRADVDVQNLALANFLRFKDIFFKNSNHNFFKEVLVESFRQFYEFRENFYFLSELIQGRDFQEFFLRIYQENARFQETFNAVLDDYRREFRFRYKNYPFPKLQNDELPFWIVKGGQRMPCFKKDIELSEISTLKIFPRAITLTIFLRLFQTDLFIHGIGGANYEWVQDRMIERFFGQQPPLYIVTSGTFLIDNFKERDFPYFLFSPEHIRHKAYAFYGQLI
jgi:hypothetical protein